jgi:NAD(P)-dependent dehydrogenase (short-subunit alcohol dehydrogenase family)
VAAERGEHDVRVNSVSPAAMATVLSVKALGMRDASRADTTPEQVRALLATAPRSHVAGFPTSAVGRLAISAIFVNVRMGGGRRRDPEPLLFAHQEN